MATTPPALHALIQDQLGTMSKNGQTCTKIPLYHWPPESTAQRCTCRTAEEVFSLKDADNLRSLDAPFSSPPPGGRRRGVGSSHAARAGSPQVESFLVNRLQLTGNTPLLSNRSRPALTIISD